MVGKRPHQSSLIVEMRLEYSVSFLIRRLRPCPIPSNEVAGESCAVVRIRLSVWHTGHDERNAIPSGKTTSDNDIWIRFKSRVFTEKQFVIALVIAFRLLEWDAVLRHIGQAHTETIRLYTPISIPITLGRIEPLNS